MLINFLVLSSEQLDYPIFCFEKSRVLENTKKFFGKYEGTTFPSEEITSIVGFTGIPDGRGVHIGYKMGTVTSNKLTKSDETKAFFGEFPVIYARESTLFFFYTNIIEYQFVVDAKAPFFRFIDSKQRLKNGSVCELEPTHRIVFSNLDYK